MLPYCWYLLKVIICSGILLGYYWLFLRNKIYHQYNRFYLLTSVLLSLAIPFIKISLWQQLETQNQAIRILQAVAVDENLVNQFSSTSSKTNWDFMQLIPILYGLGSFIILYGLLHSFYTIWTLIKNNPQQKIENICFVNTNNESAPFSFFKFIIWNNNIDINSVSGNQIYKHELAHVNAKHSYDKLLINILLIFYWCNPFFWAYRKELNIIHEFSADKKAIENADCSSFAAMILQAAYPKQQFEITNNFFYSPIKRRLMMLTKIDNSRLSYFARIMVLPLAIIVFAAFTFQLKSNSIAYQGKKITLIIDAGHGGRDFGSVGAEGTYEKDLALEIAKKIKMVNKNEAIEIILTRDDDTYLSPPQKVDFAKANKADLLISIHLDGEEKSNKNSGMKLLVSRNEFQNSNESKILASAIINQFDNNYALAIARAPQQRPKGIWILQASPMPSVIIEAGFISNKKDLKYLKTNAAKELFATNVLAAVEKYMGNKQELK